ncbi:MAG: tRNA epoxyqueuosine(34) reductase QueG [Lentisphaerae bacterium]|nr:tRNA epoxyqueuosine(34) reductase QueG [Lentisphaerota bacterium]
MTLEEEIMAEAKRLGFADAGIAVAAQSETISIFDSWLNNGLAGNMTFLKKHRHIRSDIRNLLPDAKSVIVVAARYPTNPAPGTGFATYARGRDYHTVIKAKLKLLSKFISSRTDSTAHRACVDSAPVLEREWAVRAGIGWLGKQGQVISPNAGCCILLGELLVDIELKPSQRLESRCNSCRLCIEACPTGALQEDGHVNSQLCISYLTIEHRGDIPGSLRKKMGQSLFGCDFCTSVCPWNTKGQNMILDELSGQIMPTPEECMAMTENDFETRFMDSAVLRTGLKQLRRNAFIATDNRNIS